MQTRTMGVFADRLSDLITESGKTLRQIASEIGISYPTLSTYQNGIQKANIEALAKIANYFNVSADYLLGLSDAPTTDKTAAAAVDYTGLAPDTVKFLHTMHSVLGSDMFARAVDFLITDAQYKSGGSDYNPLLKAISVFLKLDASDNKQVYVMNASGDIQPFDSQGGRRGIRSNEIAFDGDMSDAVALAAISQKLHTLKAAQKRKAARKRNKGK